VNAYEVKAGISLIAALCDVPERLRGFTTRHYINPLYLYLHRETVLLIFSFIQTSITSQMWPSAGKRVQFSQKIVPHSWCCEQKLY